jgi:hypothetical protein
MAGAVASAALVVVAAVAAVPSRSPVTAGAILAAAGAMALLSRRLPAAPFEPPPESPMTASFRAASDVAPARGLTLRSRVRSEIGRMLGAGRGFLAAVRSALARRAPSVAPGARSALGDERTSPARPALARLAPRIESSSPGSKAEAGAR